MLDNDHFTLVIPVYKNEENIPTLLAAVEKLHEEIDGGLEAVFVVDGSPDRSYSLLIEGLADCSFPSKVLRLARNFGSFSAIRAGLEAGTGLYFGVMAADLQEPPELMRQFHDLLSAGNIDVCLGVRTSREDPGLTSWPANLYWSFYRRFIVPEVPSGGIDIFGCTRLVRDHLLSLRERNSSLVGLLLWVGFRRATVPYGRRKRLEGKSAWTLGKKLTYLLDSIFSFSDLPIRALTLVGWLGLAFSFGLACRVLIAKFADQIPVPGYTTLIIIVAFFGGLNCLGLGILGGYVWRTFENTKGRPNYIVAEEKAFSRVSDV